MKKIFSAEGVVVAVGWGIAGVTVAPAHAGAQQVAEVADDSPVAVGWLVEDGAGEPVFTAPPPAPPTVGPNEFYFLWTMAEQVAIEAIREADPGVKLFMRRLDDPRTTEVVLADPMVQEAIQHTVEQLVEAGVIAAEDADARAAAIIAGGRA